MVCTKKKFNKCFNKQKYYSHEIRAPRLDFGIIQTSYNLFVPSNQ